MIRMASLKIGWLSEIKDFIIAFIIAVVFYQVLTVALNTGLPIVSVYSYSMYPVLHRGDLLFVNGWDNYMIGDVIIYQTSARAYPIVHRAIEDTGNGFITKGDNNPITDQEGFNIGPIKENQINGRVIFGMPLLGYPKIFLDSIISVLR